jgi:hypothetical protein
VLNWSKLKYSKKREIKAAKEVETKYICMPEVFRLLKFAEDRLLLSPDGSTFRKSEKAA